MQSVKHNTDRMALSIATSPCTLPCAPDDAAERPEKRATMPAAIIYARLEYVVHAKTRKERTIPALRPYLSDM